MKSSQKGYSSLTILLAGFIIIILLVLVYILSQPKPTQTPINSTNTSTSTDTTVTPTTTDATSTPATENAKVKTFAEPTLGLSFDYPLDFFLKSSSFAANGSWSAYFTSDRGDITVRVAKGPI